MTVMDRYRVLERKIESEHGRIKDAPEDDSNLIELRELFADEDDDEIYQEEAEPQKNIPDISEIKLYEPAKDTVLRVMFIKEMIFINRLYAPDFSKAIGRNGGYLNNRLLKKTVSKTVAEELAYWLGVDLESITKREIPSFRQPQVSFDSKKVQRHIKKCKYKVKDIAKHIGSHYGITARTIREGKGPEYIVKSLCDMADVDYWEE